MCVDCLKCLKGDVNMKILNRFSKIMRFINKIFELYFMNEITKNDYKYNRNSFKL